MRHSLLRDRLSADSPIHCFKVNVPHPLMVDMAGSLGMDCLWLCMEHGMASLDIMFSLIVTCDASDTDSVVRVPNGEFALAAKLLDAGASAIMYPRARSVEEIHELVRWLRHPPLGIRGVDPGTRNGCYTAAGMEGYRRKSAEAVLIVQIETAEALEAVDEIAAIPGIDILFMGPADLSQALGVPLGPEEPALQDAIERVAAAADAHGLAWGTPALSIDHARSLLARGARFVTHGSDISWLRVALQERQAELVEAGFPFGR